MRSVFPNQPMFAAVWVFVIQHVDFGFAPTQRKQWETCSRSVDLSSLFAIRHSNPQQHQSTGGAERSVRRLKENLSILRSDVTKHGVALKFAHEPVQIALTYLALCHNHFSKTPGTDLSPLESACGRKLIRISCLVGTTVIAELPDSAIQMKHV